MTKYFAYGSNCNAEVMRRKAIGFTGRERAVLPDYRLLFNKRSLRENLPDSIGFANIEPSADSQVEGILYELVEADLRKLDESERFPAHYDRVRVVVQTDSGPQECWVYQAQVDKTAAGLVPSRNYLNHILAGQEFLSQQYFEALDQSQTYQASCGCCDRESEVLFVEEAGHMYQMCQACREARLKWGDVLGNSLTVAETREIMQQLVINGPGFSSLEALIDEAVSRQLVPPPSRV